MRLDPINFIVYVVIKLVKFWVNKFWVIVNLQSGNTYVLMVCGNKQGYLLR